MKAMNPDEMNFDEEALEILEAYHKGELQFGPPSQAIIQAAQETLKKNKNINIRINENDLTSIKIMAAREGIPYQTLIGSILHKYTAGILKEAA
jgi:predicted DNA binding CopG/RHH family protein